MSLQVVTANRLRDGLVVYLTEDGGWSEWITEACIAASEEGGAARMAVAERAVEERLVVDPYLIDVTNGDGALRPARYRELIRSRGPTDRTDLGKQARPG